MPIKRKEARTCHDCGLEDVNACERGLHRSSRETLLPCNSCVRNSEHGKLSCWASDFFHMQWRLDANGQPGFDDIDPRAAELLRTLHLVINDLEVTAK